MPVVTVITTVLFPITTFYNQQLFQVMELLEQEMKLAPTVKGFNT